jgi:hypothetical protein
MGLLDDAIREHLELKRRRGADPDELARAEHEALGPVRRERFESESGDEMQLAGRGAGLAEPEHEGADDFGFGDGEDELRLDEGEGRNGLSEAEHEEYYDEDYEEPGEWEEPLHGTPEGPANRATEPREDETLPARDLRERVGPESTPSTHAIHPEVAGQESEGEETAEYSIEDAVRARSQDPRSARGAEGEPAEPDGEDVLEETPEFLQDAPEHDRLWFEQRPPRDFDFDG